MGIVIDTTWFQPETNSTEDQEAAETVLQFTVIENSLNNAFFRVIKCLLVYTVSSLSLETLMCRMSSLIFG